MKKLMFVKTLILVLGLVQSVGATDYVVNNTIDLSVGLSKGANYEGGVAPQNWTSSDGLADSVSAKAEIGFLQTLKCDWSDTGYLGSIDGDVWRELDVNPKGGMYWKIAYMRDVSGFPGLLFTTALHDVLYFQSPTTVPQIDFGYGFNLVAKGADNAVIVKKASGVGGVSINADCYGGIYVSDSNAAAVTVEDALFGSLSFLHPLFRGITFWGHETGREVVGTPYLHLDASVTNSLVISEAGGQHRVTRWNDVRGEGHPYAHSTAANFVPWVSTDEATGKPVVNFGVSATDYGNPIDNCWNGFRTGGYMGYNGTTLGFCGWLALNQRITEIREVFVVMKESSLYNCSAYFLGDGNVGPTEQPFQRGWVNDDSKGRFEGVYYQMNRLFKTTKEDSAVRAGDIRLDGQRVRYNHVVSMSDRLHVLSVGTAAVTAADRIGDNGLGTCKTKDRNWAVGGFELAEMIVYTNVLTSAERRRVNDYLKAKWQPADDGTDVDFGQVVQRSTSSIGVEGGVLKAGRTSIENGTKLTKTGTGVYDAGVPPSGEFSLDVRGGSVSFTKSCDLPATAPTRPAPGSDIWIDAENSASLETEGPFVTRMNHCENGGYNAAGYKTYVQRYSSDVSNPTLVTSEQIGGKEHAVFDFGTFRTGYDSTADAAVCGAYKEVPQSSAASPIIDVVRPNNDAYVTRVGFVVFKASDRRATIVGSANRFCRVTDDSGRLFGEWPANTDLASEYFALDGEQIKAFGTEIPTGEYHVLSYRFSIPTAMNTLAGGNLSSVKNIGGLRVGEWIQYDRELSWREFRETEAYLLMKWLNRTHPDVAKATGEKMTTITSAVYAEDVEPALNTDFPMAVGFVDGRDSFTKSGAGTVAVAGFASTISNLTVEGGALAAEESIANLFRDAFVHFDASDDASFTFAEGSETRVARWSDVRSASGASAMNARLDDSATELPRRLEVEINGVKRKVLDFNEFCRADKDHGNVSTNGGTRLILWDGNTKCSYKFGLHEFYVVRRETSDEKPQILAAKPYVIDRYQEECFNYMTFPPYHNPGEGYSYRFVIDDTERNFNYKLQDGTSFHVFCLTCTGFDFQQLYLGGDLTTNGQNYFGGQQIAEVVTFETARSDVERQAIIDYLRKKWMGVGDGATKNYASVSAAHGASFTLELSGWNSVSLAKLSGGGSVDLGAPVAGLSEIDGEIRDDGTSQPMTVANEVTLSATGVVKVRCPIAKLKSGFYPLFTAASITNPEVLANWAIELSQPSKNPTALEVRNGQLGLVVKPFGLVIIVQ